MCTVVLLLRPGADWPVLIGANRDEMLGRPWRPPACHWPDRPEVTAGLDQLAGGSWLGINRDGVVAAMLNRRHSLGPAPGMRSRGELVLEALDHADAASAAAALVEVNPAAYRSFNMVVADNSGGFWLRHAAGEAGRGARAHVESFALEPGITMLTAYDRNDPASRRIQRFLPRFTVAAPPDPERGDWRSWIELLASPGQDGEEDGIESAMCVATDYGFGTSSSSLLALPAPVPQRPVWLFAPGRPDATAFQPVPVWAGRPAPSPQR